MVMMEMHDGMLIGAFTFKRILLSDNEISYTPVENCLTSVETKKSI